MKKIMFVMLVLAIAVPVAAQEPEQAEKDWYVWFEPQVAIQQNEEEKVSRGEYFGVLTASKQWSKGKGIFFQTGHGNLWGETVIGPSFELTDADSVHTVQVSAAAGVDHHSPRLLRGRLNFFYDNDESGSFAYSQFDFGKGGKWVWTDATLMLNKKSGFGILIQMPGGGIGPKYEFQPTKNLAAWAAVVQDWQEDKARLLVGMKFKF